MDKPLEQKSMELALTQFSQALQRENIEHFVFFGTLLGLTRDGKPIAGDSDVDFYVNKKDFQVLCNVLTSSGVEMDFENNPYHTKHFINISGTLNETEEISVDFYIYDATTDNNFLLERWNFAAQPDDEASVLKIPKPLVYPIEIKTYLGQNIAVPQCAEIICEFLYGINWRIPQRKGIDYGIVMMGGRPLQVLIKDGKKKLVG